MLARDDGTCRYFSVREAARLQTFPDSYVFPGSWTETMRQIGNAVPVRLAHVFAIRLRDCLKDSESTLDIAVDDIWIPLGESLLIGRFSPIWNTIVDGFGNHDPGSGRRNQARSRWDVLHPGRNWAELLRENETGAQGIIGILAGVLSESP